METVFMTTTDPVSEIAKLEDTVRLMEFTKMLSLYSDVIEGEPVLPRRVVQPRMAKIAVEVARKRVRFFEKMSKNILDSDIWSASDAEIDAFLRRAGDRAKDLLKDAPGS